MAWKQNLHDSILGLPILYMDGTMNPTIASSWLERLDVVAEIKSKTPDCVTRRQVGDRALRQHHDRPQCEAEAPKNEKHGTKQRLQARPRAGIASGGVQAEGKPNDDGEVIDTAAIVPMATDLAMSAE